MCDSDGDGVVCEDEFRQLISTIQDQTQLFED